MRDATGRNDTGRAGRAGRYDRPSGPAGPAALGAVRPQEGVDPGADGGADGFTPQQGITCRRRAGYAWAPEGAANQGEAHLDTLTVRVVPENSSRLGALTSGQADAVSAIAPVNVAKLKSDPEFTVQSAIAPGVPFSHNPNTEEGLLADVRLRKALRAGIDWSLIVEKLYFGVHPPARGPLSPTTPGFSQSVADRYEHDPAAAAGLLDEAGWTTRDAEGYRTKDGRRLILDFLHVGDYFGPHVALATQIQAAAKQLRQLLAGRPAPRLRQHAPPHHQDRQQRGPHREAGVDAKLAEALASGDPVDLLTGLRAGSDQLRAEIVREYGLDRPLPLQYLTHLGHMVQGDLGDSYVLHLPVRTAIGRQLGATLALLSPPCR